MKEPRVLVVLGNEAGWSRGILRGFMAVAHASGWVPLHYHPNANLGWLAENWRPDVAVVGPEVGATQLGEVFACPVVSVNADRSAQRIASVLPDEDAIGALALQHLRARGHRRVTTFRFDESPFAVARERAFLQRATAAELEAVEGWWIADAEPSRSIEDAEGLVRWIRGLPRPCGILACSDAWARVVARYARVAGLRIPEDLALVGVDNDLDECELIAPPVSSVAIPWRELGAQAASLVRLALKKRSIAGKRIVVAPLAVVARRSSDAFGIEDPLVLDAVTFIHAHAAERLTVPKVASSVASSRQRLERKFRAALASTVQQEIRRARVERARRLLEGTEVSLSEVAKRSGFSTAALLSVAFQRELGMPPGVYRRRSRDAFGTSPEE